MLATNTRFSRQKSESASGVAALPLRSPITISTLMRQDMSYTCPFSGEYCKGHRGFAKLPSQMAPAHAFHVDPDETAEQFVMGQMPADVATAYRVHTRSCPECANTVAETTRFVQAIRLAADRLEPSPGERRRDRPRTDTSRAADSGA